MFKSRGFQHIFVDLFIRKSTRFETVVVKYKWTKSISPLRKRVILSRERVSRPKINGAKFGRLATVNVLSDFAFKNCTLFRRHSFRLVSAFCDRYHYGGYIVFVLINNNGDLVFGGLRYYTFPRARVCNIVMFPRDRSWETGPECKM